MKRNHWLIPAATILAGLLAQRTLADDQPKADATPAPAATAPAEAAKPPAAKPEKKKSTAKKPEKKPAATKPDAASQLRSVPLVPGAAIVVASNVNVRGQAKLKSEIVTKLTKGDSVTVIEEITLKNSGADEPSAWAKIVFPAKAHVWVHTEFIDATNKTVKPKKLNARTGPGENYSVAGVLLRGDAVKEVQVKEKWMEIEAPANAYAFMAAQYLEQAPTTATVAEATPVAPPPTEPPAVTAAPTTEPAPTPPPPVPAPEVKNEPPPKRIVQREGIMRGTVSIQAPTRYSLVSMDNGKTINYLYTTSPYLDLSRYKGLHIIVTGEEGLDERWKNTPIITIQRIQVIE